jgi:hypothetical protein
MDCVKDRYQKVLDAVKQAEQERKQQMPNIDPNTLTLEPLIQELERVDKFALLYAAFLDQDPPPNETFEQQAIRYKDEAAELERYIQSVSPQHDAKLLPGFINNHLPDILEPYFAKRDPAVTEGEKAHIKDVLLLTSSTLASYRRLSQALDYHPLKSDPVEWILLRAALHNGSIADHPLFAKHLKALPAPLRQRLVL